ncbi:transporter [Dactylosporangium sucinum]|uniref:transporter n=1 Tax=Dactylosporangium sucinum TaxID=1424081 RepID=UPI00167C8100|nr:transporter [Dactylosporangium sucinum]
MNEDDDAPPESPAESLAMISRERDAVSRSMRLNPLAYYLPWGFAWLIGFGLLFLRYGPHGRVYVPMPGWLPLVVLVTLLAGAAISTIAMSAAKGRHVHGRSSWQGAAYGWTWFLAFSGVGSTLGRFTAYLPESERGLLWASVSVGVTAIMYLAGSAIWLSREMFVLGAWVTVVNIAGVAAGPGWHSLLVALGGGGGLILFGLAMWVRGRRR